MEIDFRKNYKFWLVLLLSIIIIFPIMFFDIEAKNIIYAASFNPTINEEKYDKQFKANKVGDEIGEIFVAQYDNLKKVFVKFENLKVENSVMLSAGNGVIGLKDQSGKIICEKEINVQELTLNTDYELTFPKIKDSANKNYYVYFKCTNLEEKGEFFEISYSEEDLVETGKLFINGKQTNGDMYFQEMYENTGKILRITIYMIIVTSILAMIAIVIYYHKKITPEKLFWIIIPAVFIMFFVLMPAFKNHDEGFHWFRILDIAQGNLLTNISNNKPIAVVPESTFTMLEDEPEYINYKVIMDNLQKSIGEEGNVRIELATTAIYNPIQYFPQTLGVIIMKFFTNNPMLMAYAARFTNMIISIIILYLAFKKMPFGKLGLLVTMCLPIAIEGFTSMSSDAITVAIAFLFTAYIFDIVFNKNEHTKINKKDILILLVLAIILAVCKIVYLPIVGLMLLLSRNKFKNNKIHIITVVGIMLIAIIANLLWLNTANTYLEMYKDGNSNSQIATIFQNPILYLQRVLFTFNDCANNYLYSLFGDELGWNEFADMNYILPIIIGGLFIFIHLADKTWKVKLSKYQNIIILLIILAVIGLIFTSLYIQWNESKDNIIKGIQGRYFIPILPLLMLLIGSNLKLQTEFDQEKLAKISGITLCIIYMYVFMRLIILNI